MIRYKDTNYFIGENGEVFNEKTQKYLKPTIYNTGYYYIKLGSIIRSTIHRLVATLYVENPNNHNVVNHIDGNKLNNSYTNLEWCTTSHNIQHSYDMGFSKKRFGHRDSPQGSEHWKSIVTEEQVREIRTKYENTKVTQKELAQKYGLTRSAIGKIVTNKIWKHILCHEDSVEKKKE